MEKQTFIDNTQVIDMMITMHSILAHKYNTRSKMIDISMFGVSILLVASTFFDPNILVDLKIDESSSKIIIGSSSIFIFFMSIISLIVDWKGRAMQHKEAFSALLRLKIEKKDIKQNYDSFDDNRIREFLSRSSLVMGQLIPIPDSHFNSLIAEHYNKVGLSKYIKKNSGSAFFFVRLKYYIRKNISLLK